MPDRHEEAKRALIGAAAADLAAEDAALARLARSVFARTAAEDIAGYTPADLADVTRFCWSTLAERQPGRHALALFDLAADPDRNRPANTVLAIVNDDMPFLLDSVMGELQVQGCDVLLVAHPIVAVERSADGRLAAFGGDATAATPRGMRESVILVFLGAVADAEAGAALTAGLDEALDDVRAAVTDWKAMRAHVAAAASEWRGRAPASAGTLAEAEAFLAWLDDHNFTFLGLRDYDFIGDPGEETLERRVETGLGILRDPDVRVLRRGGHLVTVTPAIRALLLSPDPLIVTKADVASRVHRRAPMDYVGIKRYAADGSLAGETRLIGLFTHTAYTRPVLTIPEVRRKVETVLARFGFDPASHSGKAALNILETFPRDELFRIDIDALAEFAGAILELTERPRVRVLARRDEFDRFVFVLVFIPRERATRDAEERIAAMLAEAFGGQLTSATTEYPEGPLARLTFIITRSEGDAETPERQDLEAAVARLVRTWLDEFAAALARRFTPSRARALLGRYGDAFSPAYRDTYDAEAALADLAILERISTGRPTAVHLLRRPEDPPERVALRLFSAGAPIALSDRVPIIEAMGFRIIDERTFRIHLGGDPDCVYLHDMTLDGADGAAIDIAHSGEALEAMYQAVAGGRAESDGFNALLLSAGLGWRDIAVLRAISRYLRQARIPYSQDYMWGALNRSPAIAAAIVSLFHLRFDPDQPGDESALAAARAAIEAGLEAVPSLDDDRILRRFANLVEAMLRTTFFTVGDDGMPKDTIAFKLDSHAIDDLPAPRPFREIWVYGPRVEGVHLRFGKVARGGIRWSDRPQDFRTEVLGLVKAQQVKNAVIVPVGAKGGFLPKALPVPAAGREAWLAEGTAAYRTFIANLLEISDNLDGGEVVPPERVVRYDDDDPYLVVAADKGTATFSDIANGIAEEHGFWLGDAFASGGSAGYDHKKMGITARGAWEAVKRHFREIDVDIQKTPFTVVGVGDMSGDVFGNGMLLSPATKLVAAFDHRDIFIDPDPDPAATLAERARLFALPRSSWQDYDKRLISPGGGIFPRTAKSIPVTPEMRAVLGIEDLHLSPAALISAILRAPADLLWFGGIGTYVRASSETDLEAGDRANDAVRITAAEIRAKVVGEGANLGMTQRGRIEAARRGVRLNTDAIDNSAGVNTSDVEVNLKIALARPMREGRLARPDRDALLREMTDEVAALVLRNNYLQTLALSLAERKAVENLGFDRRTMQVLESRGLLDRAIEFLPSGAVIAERLRDGTGLTRPELAVLLAYSKTTLFDDIIASSLPDDPYLASELADYFPPPLRARFPEAIAGHRLRREIIATMLSNAVLNRGGPSFVVRLGDDSGADPARIAAAFVIAFDSARMGELNDRIDRIDGQVPGAVQLELYASAQELTVHLTGWFLRNIDVGAPLGDTVARFRDGIDALSGDLDACLPAEFLSARSARATEMVQRGVPADLAMALASLPAYGIAPDAVIAATRTGLAVTEVAATLYAFAGLFRLDPIANAARAIPVGDYYERIAIGRAIDRLTTATRSIAIRAAPLGGGAEAAERWLAAQPGARRILDQVAEMIASGLTLAKLTVVAGLVGDLDKEEV